MLGVADGKDANGNVNVYKVVNFTYKEVGGGQTGPTVVPFDASKLWVGLEAGKYFRCQLYNPWGDGNNAIDPANVKLKKNPSQWLYLPAACQDGALLQPW